jgi:cyclopropane fatty-acyl-phospholipid synthase-like methyltransferase
MKKSYNNLFWHSQYLGFKSLLRGFVNIESIKRIVCPMDISRYYELPIVLDNMRLKRDSKVLDISSPKLITSYVSMTYPYVKFWGIDKFRNEISTWKKIIGGRKNLILEYGDSTKLKYPSNFFDEVYSVSVIEHVGNEKNNYDGKMIKEVYRVLKKTGRFYLTTIISNNPRIVFKDKRYYDTKSTIKKNVFFCRIYSYVQIVNRLLKVTRFKIVKEEVCNYRFSFFEKLVNKTMPYSATFGVLNLFLAQFIVRKQSITRPIPERAEYFCVLQK